jgi:phosphatidylglycerol:prolipoprotein diacylglycerol transferase
MHPVWFTIGPLPVHWFGVMLALGFLAGLGNWSLLGRREGKSFTYCSDLLFWIMISGIVGARLAYVISDFKNFVHNPLEIIQVYRGGLIYYGGFMAAGIALVVFARMHRERILSLLDFVATSVPLGHFFGRIGCFLNGCCHGKEYSGLFSVTFPGYPDKSPAWFTQTDAGHINYYAVRTLPVHPVQLYEAALNLVVFALVLMTYRRRTRDGTTTAIYLLSYPLVRFAMEFLRGDERMRSTSLGLDVAQILSIVLFVAGLVLLILPRRKVDRARSPESDSGHVTASS